MYKIVGLELKLVKDMSERLHSHLAKLVCFYKKKDENFNIDENKLRSIYRIPIDINLPEEHAIEVWIHFPSENRKVKMRVKDLSVGGLSCILPFDDKEENNRRGTTLKVIIKFGKYEYETEVVVKHVVKIRASKGQQRFLRKYYNQIHPTDRRSRDVRLLMSPNDRGRVQKEGKRGKVSRGA